MDPEAALAELVQHAANQPDALEGARYTTSLISAMARAQNDVTPHRRHYFRMLQSMGWSLDEIGEFVGLTRARVDQIVKQ